MKNKRVLPAMSKEEWSQLPAVVRYFHPWSRAKKPLTIKIVEPPDKAKGPKK